MSRSYDIFLSHSGAQKDFVEHLNAELARVCGHCSVFFDRDAIEHGEQISTSILEYAGTCKLVVAVVSEEYFTRSRPPMMELAASYTAAKAGNGFPSLPCLLPVFLALRPEGAKDSSTQSGWRKMWQKWELNEKMSERRKSRPSRVQPTVWKEALDRLLDTRGPIYIPHENAYDPEVFMKKVAQVIARKLDVLNGGIGASKSGEGSLDQIERVAQASTAASVGDTALHGHVTVFNWESTLDEDMNRRRAGSLSTGSSTSSSQAPYTLDEDRSLALALSEEYQHIDKALANRPTKLDSMKDRQRAGSLSTGSSTSSSQAPYTLDEDSSLALALSEEYQHIDKALANRPTKLDSMKDRQRAGSLSTGSSTSSSQAPYTLDEDSSLALALSGEYQCLDKEVLAKLRTSQPAYKAGFYKGWERMGFLSKWTFASASLVSEALSFYFIKSLFCPICVKIFGFNSLYKSRSSFRWCNEFRKKRIVNPTHFWIDEEYANTCPDADSCLDVCGLLELPDSPPKGQSFTVSCQGWPAGVPAICKTT